MHDKTTGVLGILEAYTRNHHKIVAVFAVVIGISIALPCAVLAQDSASKNDKPMSSTAPRNSEATILSKPNNDTNVMQKEGAAMNSSTNTTTVTVNGQPVPVPANGSYDKTIEGANGQTAISVDSKHTNTSTSDSSSVSNSSNSSVNINVRSESHSSSAN